MYYWVTRNVPHKVKKLYNLDQIEPWVKEVRTFRVPPTCAITELSIGCRTHTCRAPFYSTKASTSRCSGR